MEIVQNQEIEYWAFIPGYDNRYMISSLGRVKCLYWKNNAYGGSLYKRELIMKPQKDPKGYLRIQLSLNKHKTTHKIHILVAQAFIPNMKHLPQVNHKDGDKTNNKVSNLEWCDNACNQQHAWDSGLRKGAAVIRVSLSGKEIDIWPTLSAAGRAVNGFPSCIQAVCDKKRKTYKGYKWVYYNELKNK